ncbi:MAG: hypothetical protein ACOCWZ_04325 [Spirochaetota bacterium]
MEIITVWGVKWRVAPIWEVLLGIVIIGLIIAFFGLLRYNQSLKKKKAGAYQLFLFKTKQKGLTNFQSKILHSMADTLNLPRPEQIFNNPGLFESAIGNFMPYLMNSEETKDSLESICHDLIITYEKVYHSAQFKEPLTDLHSLELDTLLYFKTEEDNVAIGKVDTIAIDSINIKFFRKPKDIMTRFMDRDIDVHFWRSGDAEYSFTSHVNNIEGNIITIPIPGTFNRGKEVRHPYVEVIIPCVISEMEDTDAESGTTKKEHPVEINGTLNRLNEYEAVVRVSRELDYNKKYSLKFKMSDFKIDMVCRLLSDRTITEEETYYVTFKLIRMSEPARNIIKQYIAEHL